jgi:hypothetical protein
MASNFILKQNVVSDNTLLLSDKGKVFKGGYIAIIKEYTYLNAWQDKETIKRFNKKDRILNYLNKYYSEIEIYFDGTNLE